MRPPTVEAQTKANITDKGTWTRLLYMIFFVVIFNVAELVIGAVVVVQFLFKLLSGSANGKLKGLGGDLAIYLQQVVAFLTYSTEAMPYPFGDWPAGERADRTPAPAEPAPDEPDEPIPDDPIPDEPPPSRKPKAKRTTAKKKAGKARPKPAAK